MSGADIGDLNIIEGFIFFPHGLYYFRVLDLLEMGIRPESVNITKGSAVQFRASLLNEIFGSPLCFLNGRKRTDVNSARAVSCRGRVCKILTFISRVFINRAGAVSSFAVPGCGGGLLFPTVITKQGAVGDLFFTFFTQHKKSTPCILVKKVLSYIYRMFHT